MILTMPKYAGYWMASCRRCNTVTRVKADSEWMRPIRNCPSCSRELRREHIKPLYGHIAPSVSCGPKCRNATGPSCDCSCGGANHGDNYNR